MKIRKNHSDDLDRVFSQLSYILLALGSCYVAAHLVVAILRGSI